ncbi:MAG: TIGR02453 family protein [Flavobacteriaceae bacterium]|nr:TIGR02453 family protein [Flavobacteriaceae bacterium]|tara:strand:+ start:304 stop:957 length:654 start_codon:yes stop_codon:yes gene_type:complete
MDFQKLFTFLEKLTQNNETAWMDAHRSEYHDVRDSLIAWLDQMNMKLAQIDPNYYDTPGKKAINRINNNLMFHPDRPVYKDHFGAGLDQVSKQGDFYLHFGVNECFIGGGYWHPSSKLLRSIRQAIDYNGHELKKVLHRPSFVKMFGSLVENNPLKTAPKGFSQDHEHINLLRRRSFAVTRPLTKAEIFSDSFEELVIGIYKEMLPFRRYLNQAVTV